MFRRGCDTPPDFGCCAWALINPENEAMMDSVHSLMVPSGATLLHHAQASLSIRTVIGHPSNTTASATRMAKTYEGVIGALRGLRGTWYPKRKHGEILLILVVT